MQHKCDRAVQKQCLDEESEDNCTPKVRYCCRQRGQDEAGQSPRQKGRKRDRVDKKGASTKKAMTIARQKCDTVETKDGGTERVETQDEAKV